MRLIQNWPTLVLAGALFAVPAASQAEDFQFEGKLAYDKIEFDLFDDDAEADVLSATGTYYFKPVPTDGMPVAEAAYITRASYVSVTAQTLDFDGENANAFAADVGYHIPNSIFFGRLGVVQTDVSGDDESSFNGTLGIVPIPRLFFGTDFTEDGWDAPKAPSAVIR